ncbi:MAG TPA: SDR family NAD(P)-dependent oxidoreductase [Spirochaetota bacterium]|nr:SDR family NAD(P)-dependent oxidoreductase [Spirochaetota bacterium]HPC42403.1 SDR family NAD(P)-dependent oxidoreductase [Spirochaetota bacterium]HPL17419.1 SDR family NAD(P)-dependent oxidoreductase [Spirochaetota bacterium]HQF08008.1 SDR family NAD(P)-dependent oxidoreductase [Spirochaetota bacterium]HQH96568.1 SDR family NAD(P)-dependent oxidoreductase [Spirochaetota bacterium]
MKLAAITGCDSGIGKSLAGIFAHAGYTVIISYLDANPFAGRSGIIAWRLDLRDEASINSFATLVNRYCSEGHRLEYFINNAGVALGGPFENLPPHIYRDVMEINFFGMVILTQKIVPCLIKGRGRLVVNGSLAGRVALPFLSPYTASKFAVEGWCDSVRRELNPFGIRTILLEPAGVATPIWNKALNQDSSFADRKYGPALRLFREKFIAGGTRGMDTEKAAKQIYRCVTKKRPRERYIIAGNRLLSWLETMVPNRLLDRLVISMFSMHYGNDKKSR